MARDSKGTPVDEKVCPECNSLGFKAPLTYCTCRIGSEAAKQHWVYDPNTNYGWNAVAKSLQGADQTRSPEKLLKEIERHLKAAQSLCDVYVSEVENAKNISIVVTNNLDQMILYVWDIYGNGIKRKLIDIVSEEERDG